MASEREQSRPRSAARRLDLLEGNAYSLWTSPVMTEDRGLVDRAKLIAQLDDCDRALRRPKWLGSAWMPGISLPMLDPYPFVDPDRQSCARYSRSQAC